MTEFLKRTWAVVHLDRLDANLFRLRTHLAENGSTADIMAVVKADGYGHGDKAVARELAAQGVDFFAVSNLAEALSLRHSGIRGDILILGFTPPEQAAELEKWSISQTLLSAEYAQQLESECAARGIRVRVHIKLDTGMSRIGVDVAEPEEAVAQVEALCRLPHLEAVGIFSHLSSADTLDSPSKAYTHMQITRFAAVVRELAIHGLTFSIRHLQNSAGIAFYPLPGQDIHKWEFHSSGFDYARAGILLYGVPPSGEPLPFAIEPVMELKTVVSMVKELPAGRSVSYNRTFVSDRPMRIATVPIGYADGYPRLLSNKGEMLLHGKRVPIIGNICMDQLMLDVSALSDVAMGDVVTAVGRDGVESISFNELAAKCGTIGYELMCLIGRRVPRVYVRGGKTVDVVDYTVE